MSALVEAMARDVDVPGVNPRDVAKVLLAQRGVKEKIRSDARLWGHVEGLRSAAWVAHRQAASPRRAWYDPRRWARALNLRRRIEVRVLEDVADLLEQEARRRVRVQLEVQRRRIGR